jgi:signal transduction histidine kinase
LTDPLDLVNLAALLCVTTGLVLVLIGDLKWSLERTRAHERALAHSHARLQDEAGVRERLILELEARNAELERFVYTVSHDLRTPLVTMGGYLGRVQRQLQTDSGPAADLGRARAAVSQLERILTELLELSRAGRVRAPAEWFSLEAAAERALLLVGGRTEPGEAQVEVEPGAPPLFADRARFEQVLRNLFHNAIKFAGAERPKISVSASREGRETTVSVTDAGVGIAAEDRERVFGLFERVDPGADGTGIGLAIVQRVIASQGGRVWIEDAPGGRGVRVRFTVAGQPERPERSSVS